MMTDHREEAYNAANQMRICQCTVENAKGKTVVRYLIQWFDKAEGTVAIDLIPTELPAPDTQEMKEHVLGLLVSSNQIPPVGKLESIREIAFLEKEQVRRCECTIRIEGKLKSFRFVVYWLDKSIGLPYTELVPVELPSPTDPGFAANFEQGMRDPKSQTKIDKIDGHRDLGYDADRKVRTGQCTLHIGKDQMDVKYEIKWQDEERWTYGFQILPMELPAADDKQMIKIVEEEFRELPFAADIQKIFGHKEVSYDRERIRRLCRCKVKTSKEEITFEYYIEWANTDRTQFQIQILPPRADS